MNEADETERDVEYGTLVELLDEPYQDDRKDAENDVEKVRIKFPQDRLYGRDKQLMELRNMFSFLCSDDSDSSSVVFLGGYSGTGKSSLVEEFIKQISVEKSEFKRLQFISGKFSQMSAGDPFSALAQAMNQFVLSLTHESTPERLKRVKKRLAKVDISPGTDNFAVLQATLIRDLDDLFQKFSAEPQQDVSKISSPQVQRSSLGQDLNTIKYAFQNFANALTKNDPVIMFIDDLQWADDASLQLLLALLKDKSVSRLFFIGAYRSNEVDKEHKLTTVMKELEDEKVGDRVKKIEISNLSPRSITEFIADSIGKPVEEVKPISDVVYTKTLGNICFVKQAMEELVRRNAIYYNIVSYEWFYGDVSRVQLEKFLSDDVIEMVLSKLRDLPELLQKALALAAYANDIIELGLLMDLLEASSSETDHHSLVEMMELAYIEGLVLYVGANMPTASGKARRYKFAHDRIREASCASIPAGDVRDQFLIGISKVLLEHWSSQEDDWMLFKAATNLNSLTPSHTDQIQLAELNFRVGTIASSKGAFNEAVVFLRAGERCLDPSVGWRDNYTLCLELKNKLMETECFLGNIDKALELTDEISRNAKSLTDKSRAQFCYIEASNTKSNMDYARSAGTALEILEMYGICIPRNPTERQLKAEKVRVKLALRGRSLFCLTKLPIASDPHMIATLRVATHALRFSSLAGRTKLSDMVAHRMLRFVLSERLITKEIPMILSALASKYRGQEKFNKAISLVLVAINILERFPDEKGLEFLLSKFMVTAAVCLRAPFRDSLDTLMDLHKLLLAKGDSFYSMAAAMNATFGCLNSSLRLNVIFESSLIKLDDLANNVGRKTFAVIFRLVRQCLYNFQGGCKASSNPVEVKGDAYDEDVVQGSLEGAAGKMNYRDVAVIRLMLAVYFDDKTCMEQMLDRLDEYPIFDLSIQRQHLRMVYTGIASQILARKSDKYHKWAKTSFEFFQKLAEAGSENAQPVCACLKALDMPAFEIFDYAIQMCGNSGLFNLAALMNEKCGMMLLQDEKMKRGELSGEDYLKCAFWMYHDWGAMAKVLQLQKRCPFLRSVTNQKAPAQLNEFRRVFAAQLPTSTDRLTEIKSAISGISSQF